MAKKLNNVSFLLHCFYLYFLLILSIMPMYCNKRGEFIQVITKIITDYIEYEVSEIILTKQNCEFICNVSRYDVSYLYMYDRIRISRYNRHWHEYPSPTILSLLILKCDNFIKICDKDLLRITNVVYTRCLKN